MAVKHIRKRLYQAIMLPLIALFFIAAAPFVALSLWFLTSGIQKV